MEPPQPHAGYELDEEKKYEWTVTEKLEVKNGDQDTCTVHSSNKEHWGKVITVKCKMSFYETKNGQKKHLTDLEAAHKLLTPSLLIHQISFNHVQGKHDKDAMDLLKTYKGKIIDVPEATFDKNGKATKSEPFLYIGGKKPDLKIKAEVKPGIIKKAKVKTKGEGKAITQNVTFSSDVTVQSVLKKDGAAVKKGDVIAKLTSSDLEDSITQLESQIETLEDTIEGSDSSDDDYASNVRKYKDLTMKLSTLKTERSNLTVTSKYNGIVSGTITKGKTISKGQSVCKVLKTSSYKVTINVDELDIKSVKKGQSVTVTADAVEDKTFTGKVTKVSKVGSTSDGVATYPVTIQLSNAADLLPSMSVTATITTAKAENAVLVPVSAIQTKDGESYVTVVTDDNENGTQTKVETGIINDTYAQITSGVSEGDQVKTITRSSSNSDEKSNMKGGMDAPSGGGMQGGNRQGGGMPYGGKQ